MPPTQTLSLFESLDTVDTADTFVSDVEYTYVTDHAQLGEMFRTLGTSPILAFDTEFSDLNSWFARPLLWQLSDGIHIYVGHAGRVPLNLLAPLLHCRTLIAHNGVTEAKLCLVNGLELRSVVDPMLWYLIGKAGLIEGKAKKSYGLAAILYQYRDLTIEKTTRNEFIEHPGDVFTPKQLAYAAKDVLYLHTLLDDMRKELQAKEVYDIAQFECSLIPCFAAMELCGMRVDKAAWAAYIVKLEKEREALVERCIPALIHGLHQYDAKHGADLVGRKTRRVAKDHETYARVDVEQGRQGRLLNATYSTINIRSRDQVMKAFAGLGIDLEKADKATYQDELEQLEAEEAQTQTLVMALGEPLKDLLQDMLNLSVYAKLTSTYGEKMLAFIGEDGEIWTNIFQLGASATGRCSSGKPINLQNVPTRGKIGAMFRTFFIPPPGCKMVIADYSALEQRIAAHCSDDRKMIEVLANGMDMHGVAASRMFNVVYEEMEQAGHYDRVTGEWGEKKATYDFTSGRWWYPREEKDANGKVVRKWWEDAVTGIEEIFVPHAQCLSIKYMRDEVTKTCSFALNYGGNWRTLKRTLKNKTDEELQEIENGYKATYPQLFRYMDAMGHTAITEGVTANIAGRKRFYYTTPWESGKYFQTQQERDRGLRGKIGKEIDGKIYTKRDYEREKDKQREAIRRQGLNMPVQSLAADIVKRAMLRIHDDLRARGWLKVWGPNGRVLLNQGPGACIVSQVHDEIILFVDEVLANEVRVLVEYHMLEVERELIFKVPPGCSCHIGTSWADK